MELNIIKRDGRRMPFSKDKIVNAVLKAFIAVDGKADTYSCEKANNIADYIEKEATVKGKDFSVEEIQDMVEKGLMATKRKDVAKEYITYRHERSIRRGNLTDDTFIEYLSGQNEYWNTENSNKNAKIVTVQRDYMAGIASTDISRRFILPKEVCEAHDQGIIHQHDMDYLAQNALTNCCLINLEDMLNNGTVINKVKIDSQNRLLTATTVATQIITAVASSQYGGCTVSLTHLAPFVRKSYQRYLERYKRRGFELKMAEIYAKEDLRLEIKDAVQTFNYQINSMSTTNGQAPFISVFMYLGETKEYKEELALLIQEVLEQRIQGIKNEKGVYVTQAFPKLLYCLEEDNICEDGKYYYLTELAARCAAKRLVPDFISEKKMKEYKNGDCYPCINKYCA